MSNNIIGSADPGSTGGTVKSPKWMYAQGSNWTPGKMVFKQGKHSLLVENADIIESVSFVYTPKKADPIKIINFLKSLQKKNIVYGEDEIKDFLLRNSDLVEEISKLLYLVYESEENLIKSTSLMIMDDEGSDMSYVYCEFHTGLNSREVIDKDLSFKNEHMDLLSNPILKFDIT